VDVVHKEYTVVQAELKDGYLFPGVRFTKTLPIVVPYSLESAELKNITAYIKIDNVQVIPLIYTYEGLYKPSYEFYVRAGQTYELFADREGTFIYGKTTIPQRPTLTQTHYNLNNYSLEAYVRSYEKEVYAALWSINATTLIKAEDFFSVAVPSVISPVSTVQVRTSAIPDEYRSAAYNDSRFIQVFSFDESFKAYFNSRTSAQGIGDPFTQGGGSVEWNIQGDNVIGMFIGVGDGFRILVQ
jgi:hypothetical protein